MANRPEPIESIRHSLAHLMVSAVRSLYPGAKNAIGPAIENGFYQDFDLPRPISEADLPAIEKRMKQILRTWTGFVRREVSLDEAHKEFHWNEYKRELASEFAGQGKTLTLYTSGDLVDLCRGGHAEDMAALRTAAFKLTKVAGAYWRGSEKNPMLTRIYGVAFRTKPELDAHLAMLAEAAKRDHRIIGANLDLYSFHHVSPGSVFWHGNGMILWAELEQLLRSELASAGYQEVQTPLMVKPELFSQSGHLSHYKENMFRVSGRGEEFYLKPMNCPEATLIYATKGRSFRDLPLRFAEIGRVHRNELSGTLGGLFRVRQITQDDGHIFCRRDQLAAELTGVLKLSKKIYKLFGLKPSFYLSTKPDKAMGDPERWRQAEAALAQALKANKLPYEDKPKEGTFYAPKIDIDITDSLSRRWQVCTIQADLLMVPNMPGVVYTDEHGEKQHPFAIHRAIFGSFERFIGILVEHFAGSFPVWLSPIQVAVISVGKTHRRAVEKLTKTLNAAGIRARAFNANETVGYKIRNAEKQKVPYMLVIGDKEMKSSQLAVRLRGKKTIQKVALKRFIESVQKKVVTKSLTV